MQSSHGPLVSFGRRDTCIAVGNSCLHGQHHTHTLTLMGPSSTRFGCWLPLSSRETFFIHPPLWSCCHLACLCLKLTFSWKVHILLKHNLNMNVNLMTCGELDQTSLELHLEPFGHHFNVCAKRVMFNIHHQWLNCIIRCCYLHTVLVFFSSLSHDLFVCCVSRSWLGVCACSDFMVQKILLLVSVVTALLTSSNVSQLEESLT